MFSCRWRKRDCFSGLAYQVQVFTQSDDYSGRTLTNPTIPDEYKKEVFIGKHSIVGAGSIIMPGVVLAEGALSLVRKKTEEWSIYLGNPAKKIASRKKDLKNNTWKMRINYE